MYNWNRPQIPWRVEIPRGVGLQKPIQQGDLGTAVINPSQGLLVRFG